MLEQLNNLRIEGGNARPLDDEERRAILDALQERAKLTWPQTRKALAPLFKSRGEPGAEKSLRFNLEASAKSLLGNPLEAKLVAIFGAAWADHPHRDSIRESLHERLFAVDYGIIGNQRVVILDADRRRDNRRAASQRMQRDFELSDDEAEQLASLSMPAGWEAFSSDALETFLPMLEQGHRMGALLNGPEFETWRADVFPNRDRPTGEELGLLPSPACKDEADRLKDIRNPTVLRVQNELRKVVNNLIRTYGKPDMIRIELAREVGLSKREREERKTGIGRHERRRDAARKDLQERGIAEPAARDITKWLLWKESRERCPYTGDFISFDDLFRNGRFEIEHIWPRSRSFDDSFGNKTLCRRDVNLAKGNRTPFEFFQAEPDHWSALRTRLDDLAANRPGGDGLSRGKVRRFLAESLPEGFSERQLNDTGYAARQAMHQLNRLWPDIGREAPVNVQAVTGKVTARLRRLWGLNNLLGTDGEKNRADHRHHAVDALVVALTTPGATQRLSCYFQHRDEQGTPDPKIDPPWPRLRADASAKLADLIVSHRVRKKLSGQLHLETNYGDTGIDTTTKSGVYREYVTRKPLANMSRSEIGAIRDSAVREAVQAHVDSRGGDPKRAFESVPRIGAAGATVRKARLLTRQSQALMVGLDSGHVDPGANHHIAVFRMPNGRAAFQIVSLIEASKRARRGDSVVQRDGIEGGKFLYSLSPGEALEIPDGEKKGVWTVQGVWSDGRAILTKHFDATGETIWRPTVSTIVKSSARKVSVDPIGRSYAAGD